VARACGSHGRRGTPRTNPDRPHHQPEVVSLVSESVAPRRSDLRCNRYIDREVRKVIRKVNLEFATFDSRAGVWSGWPIMPPRWGIRPAGTELPTTRPVSRSGPSAPETQELSTCSARSAARTNDVDSDEHRRTLPAPRKPARHPHTRERQNQSSHLHNSGRQCQAERYDEGPDQMPRGLWRIRQGYAASSLAPGPSPLRQSERRQMTRSQR
jgi:hypothetical protein